MSSTTPRSSDTPSAPPTATRSRSPPVNDGGTIGARHLERLGPPASRRAFTSVRPGQPPGVGTTTEKRYGSFARAAARSSRRVPSEGRHLPLIGCRTRRTTRNLPPSSLPPSSMRVGLLAGQDNACSAGRSIILSPRGRSLRRSRFRSRHSVGNGERSVSAQPASRQGQDEPANPNSAITPESCSRSLDPLPITR